MSLIKGIHHACLKCCNPEEYEKVLHFYHEVLGMPVARKWENGIMFETGSGVIEVFKNGDQPLKQGTIRHLALAADDVDACIAAARGAGYEVTVEPKEIAIPSDPVLYARVAFVLGPLGEEIEFFQEK